MNIALKEANETEYWLMVLKESEYGTDDNALSFLNESKELISLLISTGKTSKDLYASKK
jgi:four helix bundle protein